MSTRKTLYVWRNIEARSSKHCCSGRAISIAYYECVFVALGIQYAMSGRAISIAYYECVFVALGIQYAMS